MLLLSTREQDSVSLLCFHPPPPPGLGVSEPGSVSPSCASPTVSPALPWAGVCARKEESVCQERQWTLQPNCESGSVPLESELNASLSLGCGNNLLTGPPSTPAVSHLAPPTLPPHQQPGGPRQIPELAQAWRVESAQAAPCSLRGPVPPPAGLAKSKSWRPVTRQARCQALSSHHQTEPSPCLPGGLQCSRKIKVASDEPVGQGVTGAIKKSPACQGSAV